MPELSTVNPLNLLLAFTLASAVAAAAWRIGALNRSGLLAAALLGGLVYGLGGLSWALLLIAFFVSSSLLSRAFKSRKREVNASFAKGGRRDWAQVAANGGPALLFLLAARAGWLGLDRAWLAYAAALAVVTADTWATELGVLSSIPPRLITSGKQVARGTSGGITLLGSSATVAGAFAIAGLAYLFAPAIGVSGALLIGLAGTFGSLVDSFLGATVQAIYYCPQCDKETERHPLHSCGGPTRRLRGWPWLDNDLVNLIASFAGVLLALGLDILLVGVG